VTECVTPTGVTLTADPARVLARLFVPGHELSHDGRSRASGVLSRILALPDDEVGSSLKRVGDRYAARHRDLPGVLKAHYEQVAHRIPDAAELSEERRCLVGVVHPRVRGRGGRALQPLRGRAPRPVGPAARELPVRPQPAGGR